MLFERSVRERLQRLWFLLIAMNLILLWLVAFKFRFFTLFISWWNWRTLMGDLENIRQCSSSRWSQFSSGSCNNWRSSLPSYWKHYNYCHFCLSLAQLHCLFVSSVERPAHNSIIHLVKRNLVNTSVTDRCNFRTKARLPGGTALHELIAKVK